MAQSNLWLRIQTGVPAAAIVLLLIAYGPLWSLSLVLGALLVLGLQEFDQIFFENDAKPWQHFILPVGVMVSATFCYGATGLLASLMMMLLTWVISVLRQPMPFEYAHLHHANLRLGGMVWIGWSLSHLLLLHSLKQGSVLILFVLFVTWSSDVFAYFGGKALGRNKLAPTISPNKTWEGSFSGILGAAFFGSVIAMVFELWQQPWWWWTLIAIGVAVLGQVGDLFESRLKRLCDIKDSGSIMPGHGGILDRVDALLLAVPGFYYLISFFS